MALKRVLGAHYVAELLRCDASRIATVEDVKPVLVRAIEASGATPLQYCYHQFEPSGMSATVLIAESHFSMHSWPEHGYVAMDVFTCGSQMDAALAIRILGEGFGARETIASCIDRGLPR